ncbi:serine hydrolase [uncultured Kordia sp.]|uniref:serine hydrolase n=1 Tax=uncultured Kordia sp. TaxID=507699 RepID=UPI002629FE40|nr:serine hydrolase [uncultured Kordia sp.]
MNANKILKSLLLGMILLLFSSCMNSENTIESIMNDYAENGRKELGSPFTGTVLVAKNDEILFTGAYGLKDRAKNIPNKIETKFSIGSLTKQFTAMLVMQMVEEGILKLNDSVSTHLEYLPKTFAENITIHQLLSHTSGLPHYTGLATIGMNSRTFTSTFYTPKELAIFISKMKLIDTPGKSAHYSSFGYMLLGAILEEVSGKSFSELLKEKITKPLGLINTGFASNKFIKKEIAKGYIFNEDKTYKMLFIKHGGHFQEAPDRDQSNIYTAGGMHSTVKDLFIWSKAIKNNTLLSEKTTKKMLTPVKQGFAYGWVRNWDDIIERNTQAKLYSHTGSTFGHASVISLFDDGTTIIFTSNVNRIKAQKIVHRLYLTANQLEDKYRLEGYPDRGSLTEFEREGGIKALNTYFNKLSNLCGYDIKPSNGSLQQIMSLYYKNGNNQKGDSIRKAYMESHDPSRNDMNQLGYRIFKFNYQKAAEIFKEATEKFPNSPNLWDSLGESYLKCKAYEKAVRSFGKAVKLATKNNDSRLKFFQKNLEKAQSFLRLHFSYSKSKSFNETFNVLNH